LTMRKKNPVADWGSATVFFIVQRKDATPAD